MFSKLPIIYSLPLKTSWTKKTCFWWLLHWSSIAPLGPECFHVVVHCYNVMSCHHVMLSPCCHGLVTTLSPSCYHVVTIFSPCWQLEIRLATKEEHLLEKDLIFEQVCRITERHHTRAKAGKEDTVTLAKKVGNLWQYLWHFASPAAFKNRREMWGRPQLRKYFLFHCRRPE